MPLEICAEMSANHLGSLSRALAIVDAAADAGADCIKLQTWNPDTMCLDRDYTLSHGPWAGRKLFDLYRDAWTPWSWHEQIFDHARKRGLIPFSAAFDCASVDFLETLGVDRHKCASFELTDLPLIRYMASKGKPIILSTGMATDHEKAIAVNAAHPCAITVLECVSAYPAEPNGMLHTVFARDWLDGVAWGLSDHTMGIGVACAAAALGATMIEKHLTLSRSDGGPDAGFSMEPHEFKQLVTECRRAAASIGEVKYGPSPSESTELRRSLWVCEDMEEGDLFEFGVNFKTARPALGLPPGMHIIFKNRVSGMKIKAGTPLTEAMIA